MSRNLDSTTSESPRNSPNGNLDTTDENDNFIRPSHGLAIIITLVCLIAIGITGYLVSVALTSSKVVGCSGGVVFDCNDVINSRWSRWLGIPVSFLALGLYGTLFASSIASFRKNMSQAKLRIVWMLIVTLGLSTGMAAIWFISLQFFVVKHLCTYCLAAHTCGLVITSVLLWKRPFGGAAMRLLGFASLVGVGLLVGGQLAVKPATYKVIEYEAPAAGEQIVEPEVFEFVPPVENPGSEPVESSTGAPVNEDLSHNFQSHKTLAFELFALLNPGSALQLQVAQTQTIPSAEQTPDETSQAAAKPERRFIALSGGTIKLDVAQWPIIGKQDAKYVFVEMFDYTCDHCRRTHTAIAGAKEQLGDDLAVIVLPVPLNTKCNSAVTATGPSMAEACEIAQLAIAVWRIDPAKLAEIHNFLMTTPTVATYAEALAKAQTIVDAEKLTAELAKPTAGQYIGQHVELYKRVGSGTVPKILFPNTTVVGEFTSPDSLVDIIRKQLD